MRNLVVISMLSALVAACVASWDVGKGNVEVRKVEDGEASKDEPEKK